MTGTRQDRPDPYRTGLGRDAANHVPLSPLGFLRRTAEVYPDRTAVVHGDLRRTWRETRERCLRLASALARRGVGRGDAVALMAPNIPESLEAHFGVPMAGAVLNALNFRLEPETIAYVLEHGEARAVIVDREFAGTMGRALDLMPEGARPLVVEIDDPRMAPGPGSAGPGSAGPGSAGPGVPEAGSLGGIGYEDFLAEGDPGFAWEPPEDEWDPIALNYTSGTTGRPKGVVYHHRGAYLNAVGNVMVWGMAQHPVYLWTLPMFHCNGWCFPWTITAMAGTHVCLRRVEARAVYDAIADEGVTHLCGAPVVMGMLANAAPEQRREIPRGVRMMTAGAAPPAAVIERMERMGFEVTHVYGLTEVYGPVTVCAWHGEWDDLPPEEQAALKARQGVPYHTLEGLVVADPRTLEPVPRDGATMGEVLMRGNTVMSGYLKNEEATREAFAGGWFHTGDLGVAHPDGYVELKDRSKDIIITGGENVSTIEVEGVLYRHPAVLEAAVVARPDERWGETPCAFVALRDGAEASEADLIAWCRERLAHFKCPKKVIFGPLPKTSTGKIQKFVLREQARGA